MRLRRLHLRHAPGMPDGLSRVEFVPGLNLIVGPNGSGKTTLRRSVLATLFGGSATAGMYVLSEWETAEGTRTATVMHGPAAWEGGAPAVPANADDRYTLGLPDLLAQQEGDKAIAHRVAVELAGGYDVDRAASCFPETPTPPHALLSVLDKARAKLREVESQADDRATEEARLSNLRQKRQGAQEARAAGNLAARALDLAKERKVIVRLDDELGALPGELHRLTGTERERIAELRDDLTRRRKDRADLAESQTRLQTAVETESFSGSRPKLEDITTAGTWARRLGQLGNERRVAERELAAAVSAETTAMAAVLSGPAPSDRIPEALTSLETALDAARQAHATVSAQQALRDAWTALDDPTLREDERSLAAGAAALRGWLRTPPPAQRASRRWQAWIGWFLAVPGCAVALAGVALSVVWLTALGAALLGAGIALIIAGGVAHHVEADRRAAFADEARRAGACPEAWEYESVDTELRKLEVRLERAREVAVARTRIDEAERCLGAARLNEDHATKAVATTAASFGLDPSLPALTLLQQAHAVSEWACAMVATAGARGCLAKLDAQLEEERRQIDAWAAELGLPEGTDDDARASAVEAVGPRLERLRAAERERELAQARGSQLDTSIAEAEREAADIWTRAGLATDDDAGLADLLEARVRRAALLADRAACERRIAELELALHGANGPLLDCDPSNLDVATAEALVARLEAESAGYETIATEIATIETAVGAACGGTAWADARATLAAFQRDVSRDREARLSGLLAQLVLEDARSAQAEMHAPPVLARAQTWFARFTHHGWRLELDAAGNGGQGALCAVDTRRSQRKPLHELSDSTRIQLLLAVRLAAIEAQEVAVGPLPLCLDEVLSTTDSARFTEVAGSLLELAGSGRQILYFTSDLAEAAQWTAACAACGAESPPLIDLGFSTGDGAAWGDSVSVPPLQATPIPETDGLDADAYARALGVPAPDGFRPLSDWHLIHVLFDDLPALRSCLLRRIDRIGPWHEVRAAGVPLGLDGAVVRRADIRIRLLQTTLEAWRVGRGRTLSWDDVLSSGSISPVYGDRVRALAQEHARDGQTFVKAVAGLPGFRARKAEELRQFLEDRGIIDGRERLSDDAIVRRALAAVSADLNDGILTDEAAALAETYVRSLSSGPE